MLLSRDPVVIFYHRHPSKSLRFYSLNGLNLEGTSSSQRQSQAYSHLLPFDFTVKPRRGTNGICEAVINQVCLFIVDAHYNLPTTRPVQRGKSARITDPSEPSSIFTYVVQSNIHCCSQRLRAVFTSFAPSVEMARIFLQHPYCISLVFSIKRRLGNR